MFATALRRLLNATPETAVSMHSQVCPPKLLRGLRLEHWREWLTGVPDSREQRQTRDRMSTRGMSLLDRVRHEFIDSLDDISGHSADETVAQIHAAGSMRELWHLRLDVFNLVSCHHDQAEADRRLSQLNRHFPTRSPRSGFGTLTQIR
jgi:hypothetical protein